MFSIPVIMYVLTTRTTLLTFKRLFKKKSPVVANQLCVLSQSNTKGK